MQSCDNEALVAVESPVYGDARTLGYVPRRAKSTEPGQPRRESVRAGGSGARGARPAERFGIQLITSPGWGTELQVSGFVLVQLSLAVLWFCLGVGVATLGLNVRCPQVTSWLAQLAFLQSPRPPAWGSAHPQQDGPFHSNP